MPAQFPPGVAEGLLWFCGWGMGVAMSALLDRLDAGARWW